jgi:ATP-dependent exoDNAse (exonuclease V) alpha subunit
MRLEDNDAAFREWLISVGDGTVPTDGNGNMTVPEDLRIEANLTESVFQGLWAGDTNLDLAELAILTPKNADALRLNDYILDKLPCANLTFLSEDEALVEDPSDALNFPTEFLNKMTPTGLPPHELHLKEGCIVMLLRNLDVRAGLCNGTRLIVTTLNRRVLLCKFATGTKKGCEVFIPRIDCYYSHKTLPFRLRRRQFPIRLSYCMTINKSQGQSFARVGIALNEAIFSHGQLYVALSRARSRAGISILAPGNRTRNIVYSEVLD